MNCARSCRIDARGFTLVEVLVSTAVMTFIVAAIFAVFNAGNAVFNNDSGLMDLHQEARRAIDIVSRELRQSGPNNLTITLGGSKIEFNIPVNITADPVEYSSAISYYLNGNQLVRENPPGTSEVIGNNFTSLNFCCWSGGTCGSSCSASQLLDVSFTVGKVVRQRELNYTLKEKLRVRN